jgi:hypothetical protein
VNRAITQYEGKCWRLEYADGKPVNEFDPHFDSEEAALAAAPRYTDPDHKAVPVPVQEPDGCFVAESACGYVYDEQGEGIEHWDSAEDLLRHLVDKKGYRPGPPGQLRCPKSYCEVCDAMPEPPAVEEPLPGQLALAVGGEAGA